MILRTLEFTEILSIISNPIHSILQSAAKGSLVVPSKLKPNVEGLLMVALLAGTAFHKVADSAPQSIATIVCLGSGARLNSRLARWQMLNYNIIVACILYSKRKTQTCLVAWNARLEAEHS